MIHLMVIIGLLFLGLCFGSFINALVWRLYQQSKQQTKRVKKELSILHGRSMCTNCHHILNWYDLLPVVSWLGLRGRCRYCRSKISSQYPLVEVSTALLFIVSYVLWPYSFSSIGLMLFAFWIVFLTGFMALLIYDVRWMLLPNKMVFPLLLLACVQVLVQAVVVNDFSVISEAVYGLLAVGGLFYLLFQVSGGKWIGGGDVKLGFVLGLLAGGFIEGLLVLFVASLLGSLYAVPSYIKDKQLMHKKIPFGPFLIVALIFVYLVGGNVITWYQNQILLI